MKSVQTLLLTVVVLATVVMAGFFNQHRIRLESVSALTFYRGKWTTARRGTAIEQLRCVGKYCNDVDVLAVQCRNMGTAGRGNVQWHCETNLPRNFELGEVDVNCEGYDSQDDEWILEGSCGLTYSLRKTFEEPTVRQDSSYYTRRNDPVRVTTTTITDDHFGFSDLLWAIGGFFFSLLTWGWSVATSAWSLMWLGVILFLTRAIYRHNHPRVVPAAYMPSSYDTHAYMGQPVYYTHQPWYYPSSWSWWPWHHRVPTTHTTTDVYHHHASPPPPQDQRQSPRSHVSTAYAGTSRR